MIKLFWQVRIKSRIIELMLGAFTNYEFSFKGVSPVIIS